MPFILQVMMVPAYVAQKVNQLNRHRKKLIDELFFIVSMENKRIQKIRIRSPDADIFFILLNYVLELQGVTILFDTGTGNNKRLIDITKLAQQYQQELCTSLLGLHAFTRCDTTSAFK